MFLARIFRCFFYRQLIKADSLKIGFDRYLIIRTGFANIAFINFSKIKFPAVFAVRLITESGFLPKIFYPPESIQESFL